MKTLQVILLGTCLLAIPTAIMPIAATENYENKPTTEKKSPIRLEWLLPTSTKKSITPLISGMGYVEGSSLHLFFDSYLDNVCMKIIDKVSGEEVFFDFVTGNSLVVPLTEIGEVYVISIEENL